MNLMRNVFHRLSLKKNHIITKDPIQDSDIDFDVGLDECIKGGESGKELKDLPILKQFLDHCCQERTYFFSIKKCGKDLCTRCNSVRLPYDVFERLHHLPDPIPDPTNEGHYQPFSSLFGKTTTEEYLPSKKSGTVTGHNIPFNPCKQHASNTNLTITCYECNKPRLIYSKNKVSANVTTKFKRTVKDLLYICGTGVAELVGPENFKELFIKENLKCSTPVESIYYSVGYPSCCCHCGSTRKLINVSNEFPMCGSCKRENKKAISRRKSFRKQ